MDKMTTKFYMGNNFFKIKTKEFLQPNIPNS